MHIRFQEHMQTHTNTPANTCKCTYKHLQTNADTLTDTCKHTYKYIQTHLIKKHLLTVQTHIQTQRRLETHLRKCKCMCKYL